MKKIILVCLLASSVFNTAHAGPINQSYEWRAHVTYINFKGNLTTKNIAVASQGSCNSQFNSAMMSAGPDPISAVPCYKYHFAQTPD